MAASTPPPFLNDRDDAAPDSYGDEGEGEDYVDLMVEDLSAPMLRAFLRDHIIWLFVGAGLVWVAFLMPSSPWYVGALRGLVAIGGMVLGGTRLFQINGILAELRRRQSPDTSSVPDESAEGDLTGGASGGG